MIARAFSCATFKRSTGVSESIHRISVRSTPSLLCVDDREPERAFAPFLNLRCLDEFTRIQPDYITIGGSLGSFAFFPARFHNVGREQYDHECRHDCAECGHGSVP